MLMALDLRPDRIYSATSPFRRRTGGLMTACTQPGCTGKMVDGYCDICGSPAGAAPFIPVGAAASEALPAPPAGPSLEASRRASGFPPSPTNCTQPGCTGTIVDGYCDICGSPAGAAPFIPEETADPAAADADERPTQLIPWVEMTTQPSSTEEIVEPAAADADERPTQLIPWVEMTTQPSSTEEIVEPAAADADERPTQLIPRVQMTTQPSSTQEMADPAAAGTEKVDEKTVDPAAASPELSVALGLSPSLGDMERMIASIRSGTGKVDAEEGDSVAVDAEVAAAVEGDSVAADADQAAAVEGDSAAADADQADIVEG